MKGMKRRDFLKLTSVAGGAAMMSGSVLGQTRPARPSGAEPDVILNLRAVQGTVPLLPGNPTQVWRYEGEVVKGSPDNLRAMPDSFLGPTIHVRKGQTIRINFTNNLPELTLMHWHGLHAPEAMDAHPRFTVDPGQSYVYEFTIMNRAGTYWYHPHPDMATSFQVYKGLAGLFIVSDDEEDAAGLPSGELDIPIILQDRMFNANNQFIYQGPMGGFLGDRMLINGQIARSIDVVGKYYRIRFLNASNSRFYKLAWGDGTPMKAIATDGGLLAEAVERPYLMLAPGERIEIIADFHSFPFKQRRQLVSQAFSPMGNVPSSGTVANGAPIPLVTFRVRSRLPDDFVLPKVLSTIVPYNIADAVNANNPRSLPISFQQGAFLLNGRTFEMEEVAANEYVTLNTLEVWDLPNQGGMMQMAHPMHIHLVQFQIIERQISGAGAANYEGVRYGYVDTGWKDTVMLMPGERARILLRFEDFTGKFVYHCHILDHEDMGMMRNFQVNPPARTVKG